MVTFDQRLSRLREFCASLVVLLILSVGNATVFVAGEKQQRPQKQRSIIGEWKSINRKGIWLKFAKNGDFQVIFNDSLYLQGKHKRLTGWYAKHIGIDDLKDSKGQSLEDLPGDFRLPADVLFQAEIKGDFLSVSRPRLNNSILIIGNTRLPPDRGTVLKFQRKK